MRLVIPTARADRSTPQRHRRLRYNLLRIEIIDLAGVQNAPVDYADSWGLDVRAGYGLFPFLAVEGQYEWMHGITVRLPTGVPVTTYEPHTVTGNPKPILPIWRIQPYALADGGVAFWSFEGERNFGYVNGSGTGFGFRGGVGLDLHITRSLALNMEGDGVLDTSSFTIDTLSATAIQDNLLLLARRGSRLPVPTRARLGRRPARARSRAAPLRADRSRLPSERRLSRQASAEVPA